MILGRSEILKRVKGENLLEQFSANCLEGAGYDLRLGRAYRLKSGGFIGVKDRRTPDIEEIGLGTLALRPGEYVLVETLETVNMPKDLIARILPRSSVFRCGCSLMNAVVDAGFKGTLTLGLKNESEHEFSIERNAKIAQIVFEEVKGETKLYDGKYQGGKVV